MNKLNLDPKTLAHHDDPETSKAMARVAAGKAGRRSEVWDLLRAEGPMTADELNSRFPQWAPFTASRRLSDLKRLGMVVGTGVRRSTSSGGAGEVYKAIKP